VRDRLRCCFAGAKRITWGSLRFSLRLASGRSSHPGSSCHSRLRSAQSRFSARISFQLFFAAPALDLLFSAFSRSPRGNTLRKTPACRTHMRSEATREELLFVLNGPANDVIGEANVEAPGLVRHDATPETLHAGEGVSLRIPRRSRFLGLALGRKEDLSVVQGQGLGMRSRCYSFFQTPQIVVAFVSRIALFQF
jgi:hypothetical protein